jgi:hypothetical protein
MSVELVLLFSGEIEGVESVVDTGGVEGAGLWVEVAEGGVDTARLLFGFGCLALGLVGERCFFFLQERVFLSLLARSFGGLLGGGLAVDLSATWLIRVAKLPTP